MRETEQRETAAAGIDRGAFLTGAAALGAGWVLPLSMSRGLAAEAGWDVTMALRNAATVELKDEREAR